MFFPKFALNLHQRILQNRFTAVIVWGTHNTKLFTLKALNELKGLVKNGIGGVI